MFLPFHLSISIYIADATEINDAYSLIGRESEVVILSTVRSIPKVQIESNPSQSWIQRHLGFITDEHQINVALTRAKKGLIIIGNV